MTGDAVRVRVVSGEIEAQQIRAFLESNGIPCRFEGESLRKTHGLTLNGLGAVAVLVPREYADEARELLAQVERGELALAAEDEDGEDENGS